MGISELRQLDTQQLKIAGPHNSLEGDLVLAGAISQSDAALAQLVARHCDTSLDRILRAEGLASEQDLLDTHANRLTTRTMSAVELHESTPVDMPLDPKNLLKYGVLPFAEPNGGVSVAVSNPDDFKAAVPQLPPEIANANLVIGSRDSIQEAIANRHSGDLTADAQARVPVAESCRTWSTAFGKRLGITLTCLAGLLRSRWPSQPSFSGDSFYGPRLHFWSRPC